MCCEGVKNSIVSSLESFNSKLSFCKNKPVKWGSNIVGIIPGIGTAAGISRIGLQTMFALSDYCHNSLGEQDKEERASFRIRKLGQGVAEIIPLLPLIFWAVRGIFALYGYCSSERFDNQEFISFKAEGTELTISVKGSFQDCKFEGLISEELFNQIQAECDDLEEKPLEITAVKYTFEIENLKKKMRAELDNFIKEFKKFFKEGLNCEIYINGSAHCLNASESEENDVSLKSENTNNEIEYKLACKCLSISLKNPNGVKAGDLADKIYLNFGDKIENGELKTIHIIIDADIDTLKTFSAELCSALNDKKVNCNLVCSNGDKEISLMVGNDAKLVLEDISDTITDVDDSSEIESDSSSTYSDSSTESSEESESSSTGSTTDVSSSRLDSNESSTDETPAVSYEINVDKAKKEFQIKIHNTFDANMAKQLKKRIQNEKEPFSAIIVNLQDVKDREMKMNFVLQIKDVSKKPLYFRYDGLNIPA